MTISKYDRLLYVVFAASMIANPAFANDTCKVNAERTAVVFANGMFNSEEGARQSLELLRKTMIENGTIGKIAKDPTMVTFTHVYNDSEDILTQLSEVVSQKVDDLAQFIYTALFKAYLDGDEQPMKLTQANGTVIDLEPYYANEDSFDDKDLERHVQTYRNLIRSGHRIITVSHSQGNFYSNAAFRALTPSEQASYRQVQVASPASHVADGSRRFTTFINDLVVQIVPMTLGPKLLLGRIYPDPSAHSFGDAYIQTDMSRKQIMDHIAEAALVTKFPDSRDLSSFSATLTWQNPEADLDLHVFEPSGLQVYQKARVGKVGKLVVESSGGTVQELYLGGCSSMQAGTFQLSVGNFKGNDIERGTLRITAGKESHIVDFTIQASEEHPKGPVSVKKPHKVTTVTIKTSADGEPVVEFLNHL